MSGSQFGTSESPTIVVVEDDAASNKMLEYTFLREGFLTIPAFSVAEALNLIHERKVDLMLVDVGLPDGSGFDVCRDIKENHGLSIPVIFISAHEDTSIKVKAFEAGAVDYITKPLVSAEVVARVRTHLRLKEATGAVDELRDRNRVLKAIADATSDAVATIDSKGRITSFNSAAEKMLGWDADEVLGAELHRLVMPGEPATSFLDGIDSDRIGTETPLVTPAREIAARTKGGDNIVIVVSVTVVKLCAGLSGIAVMRKASARSAAA